MNYLFIHYTKILNKIKFNFFFI